MILSKDDFEIMRDKPVIDIYNWSINSFGVVGDIFKHLKIICPPEGKRIHTSEVVDRFEENGIKYVETLNSVYKLCGKSFEEQIKEKGWKNV